MNLVKIFFGVLICQNISTWSRFSLVSYGSIFSGFVMVKKLKEYNVRESCENKA